MGLRTKWRNEHISVLGVQWSYADGITGKALEGFFEAGLQLMVQIYVQHQTMWPSIQPLLGNKRKGFYFASKKPGTA